MDVAKMCVLREFIRKSLLGVILDKLPSNPQKFLPLVTLFGQTVNKLLL